VSLEGPILRHGLLRSIVGAKKGCNFFQSFPELGEEKKENKEGDWGKNTESPLLRLSQQKKKEVSSYLPSPSQWRRKGGTKKS